MAENPALYVVNAFVEELNRAGVHHVCISPGSRSTPLTMAIARHGGFKTWTLLDERSAGFFALGVAKSTGQPVALVCTSGTATGNYLPALMEARQSNVPLIVLTADRPPELHDVGSNQTIRQNELYGNYVKWSITMPVPAEDAILIRQARAMAWRCVAHATSLPMGPVHINWPFRDSLIPPVDVPDFANAAIADKRVGLWQAARRIPSPETVAQIHTLMSSSKRGLIVCGPQDSPLVAEAILTLAKNWRVPVLADPLSQLRYGPDRGDFVVDTYDILLRDRNRWEQYKPDVVIRFGHTPTSKVLGQFLASCSDAQQIVVTADDGWPDPFFTATAVAQSDELALCEALSREAVSGTAASWFELWTNTNRVITDTVQSCAGPDVWFEGRVFGEFMSLLPNGSKLFVGNSMPVRDMDNFYLKHDTSVRCFANRGVSGIDGVVSTAVGIAAVSDEPVVLVIGDVSFYHDLNGLLAASNYGVHLTVVLVNNNGGGIFSFLPQAAHSDTFAYFQTEHGLDYQHAAKLYGGNYQTPSAWSEFHQAIAHSLSNRGLHIIELKTDVAANVNIHKQVYDAALKALVKME